MRVTYDSDPIQRKDAIGHIDADGNVVVEHRQDVEPLYEYVKEMRNNHSGRFDKDFNLAYHLPPVIVEDLMRRGIFKDSDAFKKWLGTEEAKPWKIHPGKVV